MITNNQQAYFLKNLLDDLENQISHVSSRKEILETITANLSQEIQELRERYSQTKKQLREIEQHQTGFYIWENIGCGG